MAEEDWDSDTHRRKFAEDRSHSDAAASNENARATAQAVILINGGAATATLAFLAKEGLRGTDILHWASGCLLGYACGVLFGALMMFCTVTSLDYYSQRWHLEAHPKPGRAAEENRKTAEVWWWRMRICFSLSAFSFLASSIVFACALYYWS
jgi:hypothetical protein